MINDHDDDDEDVLHNDVDDEGGMSVESGKLHPSVALKEFERVGEGRTCSHLCTLHFALCTVESTMCTYSNIRPLSKNALCLHVRRPMSSADTMVAVLFSMHPRRTLLEHCNAL